MSFVPFNNDSSSRDAIRSSPSLVSRHLVADSEKLTLQDVSFSESNDFLDVAGFPTDFFPIFPSQASPTGLQHVPRSQVIGEPQRSSKSPRGPQQPSSSRSFSEPSIYPPVIPQSPFDGTYSLPGPTHPSAWPGPGSTFYGGGGCEQAAPAVAVPSISGTVPITMMDPAAAPFSSSSTTHHVTVPTSGSSASAHMPVVRPWTAAPTGACQCPRAAVPPPPPIPAPFCRCHLRAHPLVRVDDMIEWVRPDLMRMSVWFNWSLDADAEAHESWERRRG